MPIYMDRHDLEAGVNAEHVAHIHQEDLKIEHEFGCKGLTYWFDDERKTAFCLINAPSKEALMEMHNKAHGAIPNSIIEVDPGIVESFLGRIEDPEKGNNSDLNIVNDAAFRVLMVSEVVFRSLEHREQFVNGEYCQEFHLKIQHLVEKYHGRVVKDKLFSTLISFRSVSEALGCAMLFQVAFKSLDVTSLEVRLKIGISAGMPVSQGESIFEETIEMAGRLCRAVKGQIILSSEVQHLYDSEPVRDTTHVGLLRSLAPADEKFLNLFIDFLESSWNRSHLKVDDFSSVVGLSKSQLYRKIKFITGKSLNIFLKEYRLKKALKLLDGKKGNISEIAFDSGFNSPAYFSKCFYESYGMLPSKYMNLS
ncbi:nickel-binding protein [Lutimonas sp.]|uniref:nickel-binding protein n=1 Tax=Lutimonas sp. TaxID=1872403 RepID=UPI003C71D705